MRVPSTWRSDLLNLVAAAIIALLIWAYANDRTRESLTTAGTVRFTVGDPRTQYVDPATSVPVTVEVRGGRRALEHIEEELRSGITLTTGTGGIPGRPGAHTIDLGRALEQLPAFAGVGVEIVRVRPESARIALGDLATEQVPVTAILPSTSVQGDIVLDPPVVSVTLPAEARAAVGALSIDAVVDTKNLEPGKLQQVDVDLRLPEALARWKELCRVVPPRAKVSFTLVAASAETRLANVPVRLAARAGSLDAWALSFAAGAADSIPDVIVTGPRAAVEALRKGEFEPAAFVNVPDRALQATERVDLPVSFWLLPDGVSVLEVAGTPRGAMPKVGVRIQRRPGVTPQ
jgi:hypothetical protein